MLKNIWWRGTLELSRLGRPDYIGAMMDILGDVLLSLRLLANSIGLFDFAAPWGFFMPSLSPAFACSLTVLEGSCWFESEDRPGIVLEPGDSILVLNGVAHRYMSARGVSEPLPLLDYLGSLGWGEFGPDTKRSGPVKIRWGEGKDRTRLLTLAFIVQEPARSPLLAALPPTILLRKSADNVFPWVPASLSFLAAEETAAMPGFLATATRLAELIFTSFLRAHVITFPSTNASWMRGLHDPRIGKALASIHGRPEMPWTAEMLAQESGMARSTFARRFAELIGQPPIDYLIAYRMQLACERLIGNKEPIATIAEHLGYHSERAFRQAFKVRFGMAPTQYAKAQRERI